MLVTRSDSQATGPVPEAEGGAEGTMVGRYLLLQRLGGGGGGQVYSAFDPVLDRKVALKFLHRADNTGPALIREGRLLAKVVHRSVVQVHEVAFHDGRAYMAMELVDRGDLEVFTADARAARNTSAIVTALCEIAEGIIAAHAAGVVHGDIKPSNVLRGAAGEFKVSDFGIARFLAERERESGRPAGTPAFMAPEQHVGAHPDERSDQYSFCVTAWFALTGSLPFLPGPTVRSTSNDVADATGPVDDLETAKAGNPPAWPGPRGVPGYVGDVLLRGLRHHPTERWASMQDLLVALRPDPSRTRMRRLLAIGGGLVVAVASVYGYREYDHARRVDACEASGAEIDAVWNAEASAKVRDALLATDVRYAASTADKVVPWLDDAAQRWREDRIAACSNAEVERTWGAELYARAQWCLDERKLELDAASHQLENSDAATVDRAVALVSRLRTDEGCVDEAALAQLPDPPADATRSTTTEALAELARARMLDQAGKYDEALAATARAREILQTIPASPVLAATIVDEGRIHGHAGSFADAERVLTEGWVAAASGRNWTVAAVAAENLVFIVGRELNRPVEGATWETHARVAATLAGDPSGLHAAARAANLAVVKREAGAYEEAIELHNRSIELTTASLGEDHPTVATTLGNLAAVYSEMGKPLEARALFERVMQLRNATLGPDNPSSISALNNFAATFASTGEYARAKELQQEVVARREQALGPDHPLVAEALDNLGTMHSLLGEYDDAQRLLERALVMKQKAGLEGMPIASTLAHLASVQANKGNSEAAIELLEQTLEIRERVKGPDHQSVAETLINLGTEHFVRGDLARAEPMFARAKAIYEAAFGDSHPGVAAALNNLADIALESGRYDEAVPMYERANEIWVASYGPTHPHAATALAHWGAARLRQGRPDDARPLLERAVGAFEAADGADEQEATARFDLAKALVASGTDHAQAIVQAEQARATMARLGSGQLLSVDEIDAWLTRERAR